MFVQREKKFRNFGLPFQFAHPIAPQMTFFSESYVKNSGN